MSDNFTTPVAPGTDFASKQIGNVQYPQGIDVDENGNPSLPQLLSILGTLSTQTTLAAVLAAISALDAGDASSANQVTGNASLAAIVTALGAALPLPTGAATQTTLAAVLAALVGTLKTVPTLAASAITPVAQALTTAVRSSTLTPITGRDFNVTIEGGVGVVATVDRRFTGDATWHTVITDAMRQSLPPSFALTETETGVDYSVNISAITSGTCNVRISA